MQPWPKLEAFAKKVHLPKSGLDLFLFDAGAVSSLPVLLLHGLGDEADTWRYVIPLLSDQYRVIAPDLPGFGRSEKQDRVYNPPFFQETLIELMDVLRLDQVILTGHSMGALLAHFTALECPERVKKLVLISGSLVSRLQKIDLGTLMFLVPVLGEWLYNRLRRDPQEAYRTLYAYYSNLDQMPQADRDFLYRRVNERVWDDRQRKSFLSAIRSLARWLPGQQKELASRLSSFRVPTQAIWGKTDKINSVQNGRALLETQPDVHLIVVPGAGHNLQQEKPEIVVESIRMENL